MHFDDELDARLTTRLSGQPGWSRVGSSEDQEALPELLAADALAPWRAASPSTSFADALEARLLAHAAARDVSAATPLAPEPAAEAAPARRLAQRDATPAVLVRRARRGAVPRWWLTVAAALLLAFAGTGVCAVAASAPPGSPLYGLRTAEQSVRVNISANPSDRAQLHLSYAQDDLAALTAAPGGDASYSAALMAFQNDLGAAESDLGALPAGGQRDALAAQLTTIETQARGALTQALPKLSWPDRLSTTAALGDLGTPIPHVTQATITRAVGQTAHATTLSIEGTGFQQGATAVVNGTQVGTVISVSETEIVVQLDATYPATSAKSVGISNPDGTAAATDAVTVIVDSGNGNGSGAHGNATPAATATATAPKGNGNGSVNGNGGNGKGSPTPSPTP